MVDLGLALGVWSRRLVAAMRRYCPGEFSFSLLLMTDEWQRPQDSELFDEIHVLRRPVHTDWRRLYEPVGHLIWLRDALARIRRDVVLTAGTYFNVLVPRVARKDRVVISVHNPPSIELRRSRFGALISAVARATYPRCEALAVSTGVADDLRTNYHVRRCQVILHGIDVADLARRASESAADVPTRRPYVVACGRFTRQKDYPTLLRGFAWAVGEGLAEDLVLIGYGEDEAMLRALAGSLGVAHRVHFVSYRANPLPYFAGARAMVHSSLFEGFGLVLLEAMALGVPCIATACPGGPVEILEGGRSGLLVRPGDPEAMGQAILRLMASQELRCELAREGRRRAAELSMERMAQGYRRLLLGLP
jgi:glycosyltransferase involved in cell wall biosynthesis